MLPGSRILPLSKPNIILTGFMGTGKTSVGKILAQRLGYAFIDTDLLIEEREQASIPDIFREKGEPAFRQMEAAVARELGAREGLVVATGGKLMLDPANAEALSRNGKVFCLTAPPGEILARILKDGADQRPLLTGDDPEARISELLRERDPFYRAFPQMNTDGRTPLQIAETILSLSGIFSRDDQTAP